MRDMQLGVCATTLKRACRRHGIQRWPRKQLQQLTQTIDRLRHAGAPPLPIPDEVMQAMATSQAMPGTAARVCGWMPVASQGKT